MIFEFVPTFVVQEMERITKVTVLNEFNPKGL